MIHGLSFGVAYYEEVAICFKEETPLAQVIFVPIMPLGPWLGLGLGLGLGFGLGLSERFTTDRNDFHVSSNKCTQVTNLA
jgi:hypothetical protein